MLAWLRQPSGNWRAAGALALAWRRWLLAVRWLSVIYERQGTGVVRCQGGHRVKKPGRARLAGGPGAQVNGCASSATAGGSVPTPVPDAHRAGAFRDARRPVVWRWW